MVSAYVLIPGRRVPARRDGVALVIVLAFVVLLTGLVVAFFSRAILERQISNSSANGTRVDVFAQGALATITGDIKQEIAAGSKQPFSNPTPGTYLYNPTTPLAAAPSRVGTMDIYPNLVKRSAYDYTNNVALPFYSNPASASSPPYDLSNYPPSKRAAPSASTTVSVNGRTISPARWNKALLLPKATLTSDTDFTPAPPSGAQWVPPDWVIVARDNTNPVAWSTSLGTNGTNPAIGRFAYNIYDEGGLLDTNAVGYPTDTTVASPQVNYPAFKKALAYADLTQLPGIATTASDSLGRMINGLSSTRQEQIIRTLTGWRNFASTGIDPTAATPTAGSPVTGSVSGGYTWSSGNIFNYLNFVNLNSNGYRRAANPILVSNQSNRPIASRQQLIGLLLDSIANQAAGATAERANLQNALQYLGTFSRDLNQPAYLPDLTKPTILAPNNGGNDGYGGDSASLITATGDGRINPSFLAVRVLTTTAGGRNDGTDLVQGEPLVKKRFALNRLAWLTYLGPSQTRNLANPGSTGPDADIATLEGIYGTAWLQQGTPANIKKYFGLQWGPNPAASALDAPAYCWSYVDSPGSGSALNTLNKVVQLTGSNAREADFVELLKAAVNAGSLAKASTLDNTSGTLSYNHQYAIDHSLDYAVLQLTANIIDQFDVDGYPTTIYWNNSGTTNQFVGVENLPYLNRVRQMVIKAAEPKNGVTPASASTTGVYGVAENSQDYPPDLANTGTNTLQDTGVGLAMLYPELWNPHDWNVADSNQTLGNPHPTGFAVTAQSDETFSFEAANGSGDRSFLAKAAASPGYASRGFSFTPSARSISEANTQMTFSLPASAGAAMPFFREPTLLLRPGLPSGLGLSAPGLASILAAENLTQFDSGSGIRSGVADANGDANGDSQLQDSASQPYVGFYLGAFPLHWVNPSGANCGVRNARNYLSATNTPVVPRITYRVKCQDPTGGTWITYNQSDSDFQIINDDLLVADYKGFFDINSKNIGWDGTIDPRTARFGMIFSENFDNNTAAYYYPPFVGGSGAPGWLDRANGIVCSQRMGQSAGAAAGAIDPSVYGINWSAWWMTTSIGWYPGGSVFQNTVKGAATSLRPGLLTQNSPEVVNDGTAYDGGQGFNNNGGSQYYLDADGVVRRGMAAYVPSGSGSTASAATTVGLPMATANMFKETAGVLSVTRNPQSNSRPVVLNRPFQSVADLGYVFSGTPWKNSDFFTPESGAAPLLDVFCVNDTDDPAGMVAGKVDLNTRQAPVLQAVIANAYRDDLNAGSTPVTGGTGSLAQTIATGLVTRTSGVTGSLGPLRNPSELVGKWVSSVPAGAGGVDGSKSYDGFSADLSGLITTSNDADSSNDLYVERFREATVRALANAGQTRIWNLLIDLVAQVGRYPQTATGLNNFVVEGEQRYWVHLAIDRATGQVIDKQVELVKE